MIIQEWIGAVGSLATAGGVSLVWWQIRLTQRQALTAFEDSMAREYREITQRLPTKALLGQELSEQEQEASLDDFFHYIDLSNEQVFLRMMKRVSAPTWSNWCEGIESNLTRQAFAKAWALIKTQAPDSFQELRRLESSKFQEDPAGWR